MTLEPKKSESARMICSDRRFPKSDRDELRLLLLPGSFVDEQSSEHKAALLYSIVSKPIRV
jgi:hypothetical protein